MAALLNPRQQAIVDLLSRGPRTRRELAEACGYRPDEYRGRVYVSVALQRLAGRGYEVRNLRPPGSHRGARYVLIRRPSERRGARVCLECGGPVSRYNDGPRCHLCESRLRSRYELPWPRLLTLFDVREVAS
jgi:hypothetical protein